MSVVDIWWEIAAPLLVLAGFAWCIPTLLARWLPEAIIALILNAIVSALLLICLSGAYIYFSWEASVYTHMLAIAALGAGSKTILVWGPIVILALSVQPQKWRPDL
ncbi:MAG: hypothetical protein ACPGRD_05795 [Planktomarina sp.]